MKKDMLWQQQTSLAGAECLSRRWGAIKGVLAVKENNESFVLG